MELEIRLQEPVSQPDSPGRVRKYILLALLAVIPTGFFFKFYTGPVRWWFNDYGAGLLYEVFWVLVIFFLFPKGKWVHRIPVWVFFVTSFLEVLQLWNPWFLQKMRSSFVGKALLGTSFSWWDFPHYAMGCVLGWWLIRGILRHRKS